MCKRLGSGKICKLYEEHLQIKVLNAPSLKHQMFYKALTKKNPKKQTLLFLSPLPIPQRQLIPMPLAIYFLFMLPYSLITFFAISCFSDLDSKDDC